jgi:BCD family chlorophyll transporter-like MFS transporter
VGSFAGTAMADIARAITGSHALGYGSVFLLEGLIFLIAAALALRLTAPSPTPALVPGE